MKSFTSASADYADLRERQDTGGLQILELKCDGTAVLTLLELGIEPVHLYRATEKIGRFNVVHEGEVGEERIPSSARSRTLRARAGGESSFCDAELKLHAANRAWLLRGDRSVRLAAATSSLLGEAWRPAS